MRLITILAALALIQFLPAAPAWAEANPAHAHIGHIMDGWQATPDNQGLLPTAEAEARIALQHASLATSSADDLASIQAHVRHVVHAIDPRVETAGPGHGFGVMPAAEAIIIHVGLATQSASATPNIKAHGTHVRASADNVAAWSQRIVELSKGVAGATDAGAAYPLAAEIETLAGAIVDGTDADNDGTVSWGPDEGGLKQARAHMTYMKAGEGLN